MKKVFRTSLLMGMASAAAFAADPAEFVESASATGIAQVEAHLTKAQALAKKYGGDAKP